MLGAFGPLAEMACAERCAANGPGRKPSGGLNKLDAVVVAGVNGRCKETRAALRRQWIIRLGGVSCTPSLQISQGLQ